MKIFWSWQSDTPGKTGRFLIRDALRDAIAALQEAPEVEEPTTSETREALHLDHDIQGVTGSPDLARTIFDKIDGSQIVVADVTLVGAVIDPVAERVKKLMNSNVAIELGYALRALGDLKILLVFNEQYGKYQDLPFDLRHKGGAIVFNLQVGADQKQIHEQRKLLKERFVVALRPLLSAASPVAPFSETPSTFSKAAYFEKTQVLATRRYGQDQVTYAYDTESLCYLRLIPVQPRQSPLPLSMLKQAVKRAALLSRGFDVFTDHNEFGALAFEPDPEPSKGLVPLRASTQLFQNGEIWSLSSEFIVSGLESGYPGGRYPVLPSLMFEELYYDGLRHLAAFATKELGITPPWNIELGISGIADLHIAVNINRYERFWGPIHVPQITLRRTINNASETAFDILLLEFFSAVYDAAGQARPGAFFGFPPNRPAVTTR